MAGILNFFKKHPKIRVTLIVLIVLFIMNVIIKFAIGVYFPWNREDWSFVTYEKWAETWEVYEGRKGGVLLEYTGDSNMVIIPKYIDGKRVTEINQYAFDAGLGSDKFDNVHTIIVPDGVKKIGKSAFSDCNNLKYLYIPMSVDSFSRYAFSELPRDVKVITLNSDVNDLLMELGRK